MMPSPCATRCSGKPPDDSVVTPSRPVYRFAKRTLDLIGALALLPFLAPILLILWVIVRLKMGSPALFRQERAGLHARPFWIAKFRTMIDANDSEGNPFPDAARITSFGRMLRRTSLDELPQIWNVLKGEMSFVGPRPLFMEYVPHYSPEQHRRLDVKPGITGLAQIAGRNILGWEERLRLDVDYVDRASLVLDLSILLRTVGKVLKSEGVPPTGLDPNQKFRGTTAEPQNPPPGSPDGQPPPGGTTS